MFAKIPVQTHADIIVDRLFWVDIAQLAKYSSAKTHVHFHQNMARQEPSPTFVVRITIEAFMRPNDSPASSSVRMPKPKAKHLGEISQA